MAARFNANGEYLYRNLSGASPPVLAGTDNTTGWIIALAVKRETDTNAYACLLLAAKFLSDGMGHKVGILTDNTGDALQTQVAGNQAALGVSLVTDEWLWLFLCSDAADGSSNVNVYVAPHGSTETTDIVGPIGALSYGVTQTMDHLWVGSSFGAGDQFRGAAGKLRGWRTSTMSAAEKLAEIGSPVAVKTANLWFDLPLDGDADDISGNDLHFTVNGDVEWVAGPTFGSSTTKYLKMVLNAASIGATVSGVVWNAASGIDVGTKIGTFSGKTVTAGTGGDAGRGVLLVPVTDFGGGSLTVGASLEVYVEGTENFTPVYPATVIEE